MLSRRTHVETTRRAPQTLRFRASPTLAGPDLFNRTYYCRCVSGSSTVACKACGALNGADFDDCIRCGGPLRDAEPADKATRRVAAPRRRGFRTGPGTEPLFGRWPAEQLPAAKLLLFINLMVYTAHGLHVLLGSGGSFQGFVSGGIPLDAFRYGAFPPAALQLLEIEPWRLASACWVHFGIVHIVMNMVGLIHLGRVAEPAIGSVRFIIAYVVSGVLGFAVTVVWVMFVPSAGGMTAGASGAIFGMLGLVLGFLWRRKDTRFKSLLVQTLIYVVIFAFIPQINNSAHVGGMLVGAVFGALFAPGAPKPSLPWQRIVAALLMLASLAAIVAARLSPLYDQLLEMVSRHAGG